MSIPSTYHLYDAFADPKNDRFKGNPAGVFILPDSTTDGTSLDDILSSFPPETLLQDTATKLGLPMTAWILPLAPTPTKARFGLRWFNEAHEAPSCGHATLAATQHVLNSDRWKEFGEIEFLSRNGIVLAKRGDEGRAAFRFPAHTQLQVQSDKDKSTVKDGLQKSVRKGDLNGLETVLQSDVFTVLVFDKDSKIGYGDLDIDFQELSKHLAPRNVLLTQYLGNGQMTARAIGTHGVIAEDAATGSAHCALVPLHTKDLSGTQLVRSEQLSKEGGLIFVEYVPGDKYAYLQGYAVPRGEQKL